MRIAVFGLGYVGCVTAAKLADAGHTVVGVDVSEDKVRMVGEGRSPIVEPGLNELIASVVRAGRLTTGVSAIEAVSASELALICVGTPSNPAGGLDTRALQRVARDIGRGLARAVPARYAVVVRSTVLPGTLDEVVIPALFSGADAGCASNIQVAVNPEFIREGSALNDFSNPPFTLVGSDSPSVVELMREVYADIPAAFVHTDARTAEMVKYACNAFHALKVCFANEIADVCDAVGADGGEAMRIFRMDGRLNISEAYLRPGFAFGGSCLPKDLRALNYAARRADLELPLLGAILPSNAVQVRKAVEAVCLVGRRRIGIAGLAFKAGTDDLRESPMVSVVEALIGKGFDVRILDADVSMARLHGANRRYIENEIPHIASLLCSSERELVDHAEALVIGNGSDEARRTVALADPDTPLIDLTRTIGSRPASSPIAQAPSEWAPDTRTAATA